MYVHVVCLNVSPTIAYDGPEKRYTVTLCSIENHDKTVGVFCLRLTSRYMADNLNGESRSSLDNI